MGRASSSLWTAADMKGASSQGTFTEQEPIIGLMEGATKASELGTRWKAKALYSTLMEGITRVSSKTTRDMDTGYFNGVTGGSMKGTGRMGNSTERDML